MPETSKRTEGFGESVIRRMTRVANECGAGCFQSAATL
jgi:hypothetical protein